MLIIYSNASVCIIFMHPQLGIRSVRFLFCSSVYFTCPPSCLTSHYTSDWLDWLAVHPSILYSSIQSSLCPSERFLDIVLTMHGRHIFVMMTVSWWSTEQRRFWSGLVRSETIHSVMIRFILWYTACDILHMEGIALNVAWWQDRIHVCNCYLEHNWKK